MTFAFNIVLIRGGNIWVVTNEEDGYSVDSKEVEDDNKDRRNNYNEKIGFDDSSQNPMKKKKDKSKSVGNKEGERKHKKKKKMVKNGK